MALPWLRTANIYIADSGNNRVRMIVGGDRLDSHDRGNGRTGPPDADDSALGDGGPAKRGAPQRPDGCRGRARTVTSTSPTWGIIVFAWSTRTTGIITTIAGDGVPRSAGDGGPARGASLAGPVGLALSCVEAADHGLSWLNTRWRACGRSRAAGVSPDVRASSCGFGAPIAPRVSAAEDGSTSWTIKGR